MNQWTKSHYLFNQKTKPTRSKLINMMKIRFFYCQARRISQATHEKLRYIPSESLVWRADEDDPTKHTANHDGLFYQLPNESKQMMQIFGIDRPFNIEQTHFHKTIGQIPIMIRRPALTAMDYIKKISPSMPNVRLLLYGDQGTGKGYTLVHLMHFLKMRQEHVIVPIRDARKFSRSPWETSASTSRPGRIDTPINAAMFLQQFRLQNVDFLEKLKDTVVCSKDYTWSLREVTKAGEPLINIAEHGVNRVTHASDCVAVLFKELMLAADEGKIKLATVINYTKFLFENKACHLKHADHKIVYVDEITVARAIRKLIKNTYKNGLVIASCDDQLSQRQNQTPRDVLGLEGWNHFDPFLPIKVANYSRKEFESCMNFYQDIGWLCRPESKTEEARDEIRFVSGLNPEQVNYLCMAI